MSLVFPKPCYSRMSLPGATSALAAWRMCWWVPRWAPVACQRQLLMQQYFGPQGALLTRMHQVSAASLPCSGLRTSIRICLDADHIYGEHMQLYDMEPRALSQYCCITCCA